MRKLVIMLLLMVTIVPLASAQQTLMLKYQGHGAKIQIDSIASDIPLLKNEMVEYISMGFLPIVVESDEIAWIYLNTVDDPRGYESEDYEIETNYLDLYIDLFPIKINEELREILNKKRNGYKKFFKAIGVKYSEGENGEVISIIDYDKFEKFV